MTAGIQLGQAQPTEPKFKDTKVKSEAGNGAAQVGSVLERSLTLGEDSDTDVEGEGVPMTPCVGPGKKKQALLGVGTGDPGAPGVGHVQGSPASAVEEGRAPVAVPSETNHTPMVIDSDTDEEGEVSAALTLAHLKERGITLWSRDSGMEDVKSQPQVLVERSQSASGRDSDTDVEEGKREMVPDSPMDTESQPPHRARDGGEDVDMNSPGGHLEGNQASSATVDNNATQVEEEVPPEPAVTLGEKHQLPLEEAQPSEEAWEAAVGEGSSSAVADVRKSQQLVAEDAGRECATAVSEAESTLEVGAQSRSPTAPVEQVVVYTGTRGDPTQPQREGAQMGRTKTAKDCSDESDDLCLPATQCFVERESQSSAAQSLEDEPTQGFLCTLPQEPGPSHLSLQTPGITKSL
ncbi:mediator of DNA damage checkpoint protein 1-like [Alexandromys fortis]|uniref:mediator of DNA damage checkpoint protein 1-like n=1 Tax=Alexandromys fortis TaxID=100897 RepID=UPI0021527257|nr:mediator of DNA damage checkpoint protein 1-like [Microtus fortis]